MHDKSHGQEQSSLESCLPAGCTSILSTRLVSRSLQNVRPNMAGYPLVPFDPLTGILHTILFTVDVRGPFLDPRIPGYIDLVHNHGDRELATAMSEKMAGFVSSRQTIGQDSQSTL